MKRPVIFFLCVLVGVTYGQWLDNRKRINEEAVTPEWHTIDLPLDHFNALDNRTFVGRYITNDQFYKEGGPIIVYVGGEWEIEDYGVMGGVAFQIARKHNGYLHYPEHRHFGKSLPFPKPVVPWQNLRYITPDYSLADLVYTLTHLKSQVKSLQNSQVILVGGSYAGALATWARLKYPHIVSAAYACGAVIKTSLENTDYHQISYDAYKKESLECSNILRSGIEEAIRMYENEEERKTLSLMFAHIRCEANHRFDLKQNILLQFNSQVWPMEKVGRVCEHLVENTTGTPLNRLAQTTRELVKANPNFCTPTDMEWNYLVCSFIGNVQTTNVSNYGDLYPLHQQVRRMCVDSFDSRFTEEIVKENNRRVSVRYGDNTPDVTKVLSVQGTHDPWRSFSIVDDLNAETPVVYVQGANHCLELGEEQDNETPQVLQSKLEILEQLSKWIR